MDQIKNTGLIEAPKQKRNTPLMATRLPTTKIDFVGIAAAALEHVDIVLEEILELEGDYKGREFVAYNPRRDDHELGSFCINTETGVFCDFAVEDECKGSDLVGLAAYVWNCRQGEAAKRLVNELRARQIKEDGVPARSDQRREPLEVQRSLPSAIMLPVPAESQLFDAQNYIPPGMRLAARYDYENAEGALCFVHLRLTQQNGDKTFRTFKVEVREDGSMSWVGGMPSGLRPLFGIKALADADEKEDVIIVEGEKAALALRQALPSTVVLTSAGGSQAAGKSDWSPLAGRNVLVWPDNDEAGTKYQQQVIALVSAMESPAKISVIDLDSLFRALCSRMEWAFDEKQGQLKGWDAADFIESGLTGETLSEMIQSATQPMSVPLANHEPPSAVPLIRWQSGKHYEVRRGDIWVTKAGKNGEPEIYQVCSQLEIVRQLRDDSGAGWSLELLIYTPDGSQTPLILPRSRLSDGRALRAEMNDHGVIVYHSVEFQNYLEHAIPRDTHRLVRTVGWHDGAYIMVDRQYGRGTEPLALDATAPACPAFAQQGDLSTWNAEVGKACECNSRLMLSVCAALAGPLLLPLGTENGGLHLVGPSSVGKTTALRVAASVWGRPKQFIQSWRSTSNGLEMVAASLNDSVLLLDEINQVSPQDAGEAVYMLGNGQGKIRMTRTGGNARVLQWRLLFMSTGEIPLQQHIESAGQKTRAGMEVRLLNVPADAGRSLGLFDNIDGFMSSKALADHLYQATDRVYGVAGSAWLAHLAGMIESDGPAFSVKACGQLDELEALFASNMQNGQVSRAARRFALLALAGEMAVEVGIGGWASGTPTACMKQCFEAWLSERGGDEAAEEAQALRQVQLFFEQHGQSAFQRVNTGIGDAVDEYRTVNNRAGYADASDGTFYVLPEAFKTRVCAGLNHKLVADVLRKHRLLTRDSQSTARIPGMEPIRSYWISGKIVGSQPDRACSTGGPAMEEEVRQEPERATTDVI